MEALEAYNKADNKESPYLNQDEDDDELLDLGDEIDHCNPIHVSANILISHFMVLRGSIQYSSGMAVYPQSITISDIVCYYNSVVRDLMLIDSNKKVFRLSITFFIEFIQNMSATHINYIIEEREKENKKKDIINANKNK